LYDTVHHHRMFGYWHEQPFDIKLGTDPCVISRVAAQTDTQDGDDVTTS